MDDDDRGEIDAGDGKRGPGRPRKSTETRAQEQAERDERDAERLRHFGQLRERLRAEIAAGTMKEEDFQPFFSSGWVKDMCRSEADYPGSEKPIIQDRLIWFYTRHRERALYDQVARLISQDRSEQQHVLGRYEGEYRYFRYAAVRRREAAYVMGKLRIWEHRGRPVFGHWSHDYDFAAPVPEHEGYVFRLDSNLFFAGFAPGVLRLAIARTVRDTVAEEHLPGLVLSMRNATRDPFAARFVLVHERNEALIAALDPAAENSRQRFEKLAEANPEQHYMLLDLPDR